MANYFNIPLLTPFKFVPRQMVPTHFDTAWASKQIRGFEMRACYKQKWERADATPLQIESSIAPNPLELRDRHGLLVKTFAWAPVVAAGGYGIYETAFDVSDVAQDGTYYLTQLVGFGDISWSTISEPILLADSHENTRRITYSNSFNRDDVAWTTGIRMTMRCECDMQDFEPDRVRTYYVNQIHDTETLDGVAFRVFQFYVGDTRNGRSGVPPYMVDLLNRVFLCDRISYEGLLIQSKEGSNWKITRVRGYPLIGAAIEVVYQKNVQSLQFMSDAEIAAGLVTTYEIETDFFGPGALVPVIKVEENG